MNQLLLGLAALAALAGCRENASDTAEQEQVPGEEVADRLEDAAEQSDPQAAQVLEEAAQEARGRESLAPVDEPESFAQQAMEEAGQAAASD